jgi:hypothetical protein
MPLKRREVYSISDHEGYSTKDDDWYFVTSPTGQIHAL